MKYNTIYRNNGDCKNVIVYHIPSKTRVVCSKLKWSNTMNFSSNQQKGKTKLCEETRPYTVDLKFMTVCSLFSFGLFLCYSVAKEKSKWMKIGYTESWTSGLHIKATKTRQGHLVETKDNTFQNNFCQQMSRPQISHFNHFNLG